MTSPSSEKYFGEGLMSYYRDMTKLDIDTDKHARKIRIAANHFTENFNRINKDVDECDAYRTCRYIANDCTDVWNKIESIGALKLFIEVCSNKEQMLKAEVKLFKLNM